MWIDPEVRESPSLGGTVEGGGVTVPLSAGVQRKDMIFAFHAVNAGAASAMLAPTSGTDVWTLRGTSNNIETAGFHTKLWFTETDMTGARSITVPGVSGAWSTLSIVVFKGDTYDKTLVGSLPAFVRGPAGSPTTTHVTASMVAIDAPPEVPAAPPLTGLHAWWKADAIPGPPAEAGNIAAWPDSSGNARNLEQPFSRYATYRAAAIGGKPAGRFVPGSLSGPASASLPATTVLAVILPTAAGLSGNRTIRGASDVAGLQFRLVGGKIDLTRQGAQQVGTGATVLSSSAPSVVAGAYADAAAGGTWAVWLNGAANGSGTHSQTLTAGRTTVVGANNIFGGEDFAGDIAEVLVYSGVLSAADRAAATSYLGTKYGIAVS